MTDGDKLRDIADALDVIDERAGRPVGGAMQSDLRRIAIDLDRPEPLEWLVVDEHSVRLPDVEYVEATSHVVTLGLVSGRNVDVHVASDEVEELLAEIHRSRS